MKSLSLKILVLLSFFCGLVFYNYSKAQKSLLDTKDSESNISITSASPTPKLSEPVNFSWYIDATADFKTNYTTIYYGYVSTPSALTKSDSPSAVGYEFSVPDYKTGNFTLPDSFEVSLTFPKAGRVWYRAYAKVREDHLWSQEKFLDILP